jgi:hypothetical protein
MEQSVLSKAIDQLYDEGPSAYADRESIEALVADRARLDAFLTEAVAEFDISGDWVETGACSPTAWMKKQCRLSGAAAGRLRNWGRVLRHLPAVREAFASGAITADHVALLVSLDRGTTEEAFRRDERKLVDFARSHTFEEFKAEIEQWGQEADPDGTTEAAEKRRNQRGVWLVESFGGMWLGKMNLDPVSGAGVNNELERLFQLLYQADRAEAEERLGRAPHPHELARTAAQRLADALFWMARRSASRREGTAKPTPLFVVHTGADTFRHSLCRMENGGYVPATEVLSWLEGADLVRAHHEPEGPLTLSYAMRVREVTIRCLEETLEGAKDRKECNPTDRTFSGATRRAIEIRDQQCSHPYCDRPAKYCQIDHIKPYSQGGLTTQANGRLLCSFHNRWIYEHEQRFGLTRADQANRPDQRDGRPPEAPPPKQE